MIEQNGFARRIIINKIQLEQIEYNKYKNRQMSIYQELKQVFLFRNQSFQFKLPIQEAHSELLFSNKNTEELYTKIIDICEGDNSNLNDEMIKQALLSTHLNSHRSQHAQEQLKQILRGCLAFQGVPLLKLNQNQASSLDLRSRTYSVIKYKKERKATLKEQEFQRLNSQFQMKDKQITYVYDKNFKPYKTEQYKKSRQHKLSIKLQQTKFQTSSNKKRKQKIKLFTSQTKTDLSVKNTTKRYKFHKLNQITQNKRKLQIHYNLFNICDKLCNDYSEEFQLSIKTKKNSLIEGKIRQKLWRKQK